MRLIEEIFRPKMGNQHNVSVCLNIISHDRDFKMFNNFGVAVQKFLKWEEGCFRRCQDQWDCFCDGWLDVMAVDRVHSRLRIQVLSKHLHGCVGVVSVGRRRCRSELARWV